ncbi:hypothetical protein Sru01_48430 [Sphaerisporangium rufum]|uniref:Uncharacterized protein n=1 Tax=Sphaerisporangium rufum TaxID=1381558 RepID=A0A919R7K4_9ACTN|nr:hypothetical protein [Sphaerisporangium rufum]GII79861.1 hypothetical protein Sru01_48430 [Sphaerisporangium rufum]
MPALAMRFTGGSAESRPTGQHPPGQRATGPGDLVGERLSGEFATVPAETVRRCVADVRACAVHLGVEPTAATVERIAREHLRALASSVPLAGAGGARERSWAGEGDRR